MKHILDCLSNEYGISEKDVKENVVFLSDRGPNIKYGLINAGFKRITCYAHLIHNLLTHILEEKTVKQIISQTSTLSSYFKNSGMNTELKVSLKKHTATRWNSVYIMLSAVIDNYDDVYNMLLNKQKLRNETQIHAHKKPDDSIIGMINVLKKDELIEIKDFLEAFKVKR